MTTKRTLTNSVEKTVMSTGSHIMPDPSLEPPKLHLNENLSPRLAAQLRKHGFDVTSTQEEDLLATSDEVQLQYAAAQELL
jgi:hypothetical protein